MKTCGAGLKAIINAGKAFVADLLTITPAAGSPVYLTNCNMDIVCGGHTFDHNWAGFKRGRVTSSKGLETQTLELDLWAAHGGTTINGMGLIAWIVDGGLDGAEIKLERAYMATMGDATNGALWLFGGNVADIAINRMVASITVRSPLEILDAPLPRNLYGPLCANTFGDTACGVTKTPVSKACAAGSTATVLNVTDASAANYYRLGTCTGTSGANDGIARLIRASTTGGTVTLATPFPHSPTAGDTFDLQVSCDRMRTTCDSVHDNVTRFRGCPFIPKPSVIS